MNIDYQSLLANGLTELALYCVAILAAIVAHRVTLKWLDNSLPDGAFDNWWDKTSSYEKTVYYVVRYAATAALAIGAGAAIS